MSRPHTAEPSSPSLHVAYALVWWLPRVCWMILLVLVLLWVVDVEGSLGFNLNATFGWHGWFMIMSTICLAEAILSFSLQRYLGWWSAPDPVKRRRQSLCAHVSLHGASVVFAILGLVGIGYYKQLNVAASGSSFPFWTLWSAHSWLGLVVLILWGAQFFTRVAHTFLQPSGSTNAASTRLHVFFGKAIFVGALATCALGFQDMQSSDLSVDVDDMAYQPLSLWSNYACASVIMLLLLGISVLIVPEVQAILDGQQHRSAERIKFVDVDKEAAVAAAGSSSGVTSPSHSSTGQIALTLVPASESD